MSNYISLTELNETFFPIEEIKIIEELHNLYIETIPNEIEFLNKLKNSLEDKSKSKNILKKFENRYNSLVAEFIEELNLILSNSEKDTQQQITIEINLLNNIIDNLKTNNSSVIKNSKLNSFIHEECKSVIIANCINAREQIKVNYKELEATNIINSSKEKTNHKSYFDTNLCLEPKNDEAFKELAKQLKDKELIKNSHNYTSLINIFKEKPNQKIIWTGDRYNLIWFIMELKKQGIILDKNYWKIAEQVFLDKHNEPYKRLNSITLKEHPNILVDFLKNSALNLLA